MCCDRAFIFTTSINVSAAEVTPEQAQAVTMNWVVATYYGGDCIKASQDANFVNLYTRAYPVIVSNLQALNNTDIPATATEKEETNSRSVYIADNGTCYHYNRNCSNMAHVYVFTEERAKKGGYKPCSKCVHGLRSNVFKLNTR